MTALIRTRGIPAALLNSTTTQPLARQIYRDLYGPKYGRVPSIKVLYITPERLCNSESLQTMLTYLYEQVRDWTGWLAGWRMGWDWVGGVVQVPNAIRVLKQTTGHARPFGGGRGALRLPVGPRCVSHSAIHPLIPASFID